MSLETFKPHPEAVDLAAELTWEQIISGVRQYSRDLGLLAGFVHLFNVKSGWWPAGGRNFGDLTQLITTEISEAYEAYRRGNTPDDKLPQHKGIDVELGADALLRILDTLGSREIDLVKIFRDKVEFNATRADHKPENRAKEGGKKL